MKKKTIWDMNRPSVEDFRQREKMPLTVVVDNVRSLNNIGSIFRTSDGFAVERIMLCGISATPPSPEIHKTALGAEESVEWSYYPTTAEAINELKSHNVAICCLEQVIDSVALQDFQPDFSLGKRYAFVVGNEVDGVDPAVVDSCDVCIEIPQLGTKHSLNVAVSAGIAMWHFFQSYLKLKL
ncbi:MAG: RNA methyltransferase [Muribaculaceae bacterium]|nr:RNA methyltransferase [Muribaculaceae bacterium]